MEARSLSIRPDITFASTSARVTPTGPRAARFGEVLSNTVVQSAESAMRVLPGSPAMALAVRGAAGSGALGVPMSGTMSTMSATTGSPVGMSSAQGPVAATGRTPGLSTPASGNLGGASAAEGAGVDASLQQSQDMNLYYLQLQENINAQNRSYSALSNVMKAQHETVKTAIGNIR